MVAESQARMATNPAFAIVVLSACILWMVVSVTGSFLYSRSQRPVDKNDRSKGQLYDDDPFLPQDQNDDSYWFMGVYNNPDDRSLFASTSFLRRGVNVGQPAGLALMVVFILGLAVIDVLTIWAAVS